MSLFNRQSSSKPNTISGLVVSYEWVDLSSPRTSGASEHDTHDFLGYLDATLHIRVAVGEITPENPGELASIVRHLNLAIKIATSLHEKIDAGEFYFTYNSPKIRGEYRTSVITKGATRILESRALEIAWDRACVKAVGVARRTA